MILTPRFQSLFRYSVAQKTFAKFQQKHAAHAQAFKRKMDDASKSGDQIRKTTQKVYVHPYENSHRPIVPGVVKSLEVERDLLGAEQVSPHYEHFGMARRYALFFWGGFITLRFIADSPDFYLFAKSSIGAWTFIFAYLYFFVEGKKNFFMPILTRFYRKIATMEMNNLETYYSENMEIRVRNLMSKAKSQIEYKLVHNEYLGIRNNTLLNFLINEQIALKNHIHERAESILKQAQAIEKVNQQKIISSVMSETMKSIDLAYQNNKQQIQSSMFNLALQGIAAGRMDFAKDPILPYVIKTINETVERFGSISVEEQNRMVSISNEQMESIRAADARVRDEFIKSEPKIDGSLRTNEAVAKVLNKWGQ